MLSAALEGTTEGKRGQRTQSCRDTTRHTRLPGAGRVSSARPKLVVMIRFVFSAFVLAFRSGILEYTHDESGKTSQINRFIPTAQRTTMPMAGAASAIRLQDGFASWNMLRVGVRNETDGNCGALGSELLFCAGFGRLQARDVECSGCAVSEGRQQLTRADPIQGAGRDEGEAQFLERPQGGHGEAGGRVLDGNNAAHGSGSPLLHSDCGRRGGERSGQHRVLWRKQVGQRRGSA